MRNASQQDGASAERTAEAFLVAQGLQPVTRNYRCKGGELDLIMRQADALVFVEVRLRRGRAFGGATASVDRRKQKRLIHAAQRYLQQTRWTGPCRFDVIGLDDRSPPEWIRNAFDAS